MHVFVFPYQKQIVSEAAGCGETMAMVERRKEAIEGAIDVSATRVGESLFKVSVHVQNLTPMEIPAADRDAALMNSLVSTHMILGVKGGEFISLLEPPAELQE